MKLRVPPVWAVLLVVGVLMFIALFFLLDGDYSERLLPSMIALAPILTGLVMLLIGWMQKRGRGKSLFSDMKRGHEAQIAAAAPGQQRENLKAQSERWQSNLERLRQACVNVYDHPFYVLIGEPGSGKTTALRECGLPIPPDARVKGLGGTRDCDWFFFKGATVLDTAGRWTISDTAQADAGWQEFLKSLRRARPRCPINGVIVVVTAASLLEDSPDRIADKATRIRTKLSELQTELGMQVPAHLLITKADKIDGFVEFFSFLDDDERQQLVGWAPTGDPYDSFDATRFSELFDEFVHHLTSAENRALLHHFDREGVSTTVSRFSESARKIERPLQTYVETIFTSFDVEDGSIFRGFFFSSAVQDQRALESIFGSRNAKPRAYFVRDFFQHRVFPERGLARASSRRERKNQTLKTAVFAVGSVAVSIIGILLMLLFMKDMQPVQDFTSILIAKRPDLTGAGRKDWDRVKVMRQAWPVVANKYAEMRKSLDQGVTKIVAGGQRAALDRLWRDARHARIPGDFVGALLGALEFECDAGEAELERLKKDDAHLNPAEHLKRASAILQKRAYLRIGIDQLIAFGEGSALKKWVPPEPDKDGNAPKVSPEDLRKNMREFWFSVQSLEKETPTAENAERDPAIAAFTEQLVLPILGAEEMPQLKKELESVVKDWLPEAKDRQRKLGPESFQNLWRDAINGCFTPARWRDKTWNDLALAIDSSVAAMQAQLDAKLGSMIFLDEAQQKALKKSVAASLREGLVQTSKQLSDVEAAASKTVIDRSLLRRDIQKIIEWLDEKTPAVEAWYAPVFRKAVAAELRAPSADKNEPRIPCISARATLEGLRSDVEQLAKAPTPELKQFIQWTLEEIQNYLTEPEAGDVDVRELVGEDMTRVTSQQLQTLTNSLGTAADLLKPLAKDTKAGELAEASQKTVRAFEESCGRALAKWQTERERATPSKFTDPTQQGYIAKAFKSSQLTGGIAVYYLSGRVAEIKRVLDAQRTKLQHTNPLDWSKLVAANIYLDEAPSPFDEKILLRLLRTGHQDAYKAANAVASGDEEYSDLLKKAQAAGRDILTALQTDFLAAVRRDTAGVLALSTDGTWKKTQPKNAFEAGEAVEAARAFFKDHLEKIIIPEISRVVSGPRGRCSALDDEMDRQTWLTAGVTVPKLREELTKEEILPIAVPELRKEIDAAFDSARKQAADGKFGESWAKTDLKNNKQLGWAAGELEEMRTAYTVAVTSANYESWKTNLTTQFGGLRTALDALTKVRPLTNSGQRGLFMQDFEPIVQFLKNMQAAAESAPKELKSAQLLRDKAPVKSALEFAKDGIETIARAITSSPAASLGPNSANWTPRSYPVVIELIGKSQEGPGAVGVMKFLASLKAKVNGGTAAEFASVGTPKLSGAKGEVVTETTYNLIAPWAVPQVSALDNALTIEFADTTDQSPKAVPSLVQWNPPPSTWWPLEGVLKGKLAQVSLANADNALELNVRFMTDKDAADVKSLLDWMRDAARLELKVDKK